MHGRSDNIDDFIVESYYLTGAQKDVFWKLLIVSIYYFIETDVHYGIGILRLEILGLLETKPIVSKGTFFRSS